MMPTRHGSIRLFRFAGIDLYLHWSWFIVALIEVNTRTNLYSSFVWNVLEYVALFVIVLLHEYGHSLACRSVGGQAEQIVLWPLGGVAYVAPPPRPGATLWSIAAGPLVNVILFPILTVVLLAGNRFDWGHVMPNLDRFVAALWYINLLLLCFNLLPVYPLDGGQILRSLLWFVIGRARSLMVASIIGFIGVGALLLLALFAHSIWLVILAIFMLLNCWGGLVHARNLARAGDAPPHTGFVCPSCNAVPPQGAFWVCGKCHKAFDTFDSRANCPYCGTQFGATRCLECGGMFPIEQWERVSTFAEPPVRTPPSQS